MFKFDAEYETNEEKYGAIKTELLGDDSGIKKMFHIRTLHNHYPLTIDLPLNLLAIHLVLVIKLRKEKYSMNGFLSKDF